jgi:hypothetical protein
MWLFDDLIANIDRHSTTPWSPRLSAHAHRQLKTFRYQKTLLNDLNGSGTGTTPFWNVAYDAARESYETRYPAFLIARLRRVSEDEIENAIKPYVWGQNRGQVLERRELILRRLDELGREALHPDAPAVRLPRDDR